METVITGKTEIHAKLAELSGGQVKLIRWRAEDGEPDFSIVGKLDHDDEYDDNEHDDCSFIVTLDEDTYGTFKVEHVIDLTEIRGVGWQVAL